ncbi:hypothetical protein EVAR_81409_1 [Eumeta japonica]|uniref:Uncharacterized protein n=1 Tax=Eumeta variegata TaxID=151549 RepID=A0A4C1WHE9_EUMVA|nr:hypothetical protein EVAR_81409_1 [Eumeta japonica]
MPATAPGHRINSFTISTDHAVDRHPDLVPSFDLSSGCNYEPSPAGPIRLKQSNNLMVPNYRFSRSPYRMYRAKCVRAPLRPADLDTGFVHPAARPASVYNGLLHRSYKTITTAATTSNWAPYPYAENTRNAVKCRLTDLPILDSSSAVDCDTEPMLNLNLSRILLSPMTNRFNDRDCSYSNNGPDRQLNVVSDGLTRSILLRSDSDLYPCLQNSTLTTRPRCLSPMILRYVWQSRKSLKEQILRPTRGHKRISHHRARIHHVLTKRSDSGAEHQFDPAPKLVNDLVAEQIAGGTPVRDVIYYS